MKTELKYRTFDQLLADVSTDFKMYNNEGLIEPAELIKVAQRVNYDLGLRIHKTKEAVLDIEKGKAKLPGDFYVLNTAVLCGQYKVQQPVISGTQREDMWVQTCRKCSGPVDACSCEDSYIMGVEVHGDSAGDLILVEKQRTEVRVYDHFERITINGKSLGERSHHAEHTTNSGEIRNGFVYTSLENGKLYISYEGNMEDLDGNLLVLDHPMINEYYEYALKGRILENLFINGEDVAQRIQLIEGKLRGARNNALSIVNTPDFSEMYNLWQMNRKAQYYKYYDMFKTH